MKIEVIKYIDIKNKYFLICSYFLISLSIYISPLFLPQKLNIFIILKLTDALNLQLLLMFLIILFIKIRIIEKLEHVKTKEY